ncbi:MAG: hypothetical protein GY754_03950 [bacterium]|nr:hypothetical protein [bacterium]
MGLLKDTGQTLLKYGEKFVNKTEEYSKIAKLTLDIKKQESNIEKAAKGIGNYVIDKRENGETTLDLNDSVVSDFFKKVKECKTTIHAKKEEIEELKRAGEEKAEASSKETFSNEDKASNEEKTPGSENTE